MSSESMSKLEAMFEAELERLALNSSTSTLLPNSVHQVSEDYIWENSNTLQASVYIRGSQVLAAITSTTRTCLVAPNDDRTLSLDALQKNAPTVKNRLLLLDL
ncbi:hypothetical protein ABKV19_004665 [Rosa sericea]